MEPNKAMDIIVLTAGTPRKRAPSCSKIPKSQVKADEVRSYIAHNRIHHGTTIEGITIIVTGNVEITITTVVAILTLFYCDSYLLFLLVLIVLVWNGGRD